LRYVAGCKIVVAIKSFWKEIWLTSSVDI
jgi:hypothetical protein